MTDQKAGTAATIAIISAIGSFILTFTGHPVWGLVAAILAIILGLIGVMISASPRVGGGLMSIVAIILGVLDIGISILGLVGVILF